MWAWWAFLVGAAGVRVGAAAHDLSAIDLPVYRQAGLDLLNGMSPYAPREALPFTYTPFAALLTVPLALASERLANIAMLAISLAAVVAVVHVSVRRVALPATALWWMFPLVLLLSPVWRTVELGQVNLVLLAAVVLDAFVVPTRHRGWLTGIAAGVKLVPATFVVFFWVTRQRSAAARVVAAMGATALVGLVALPSDSLRYWFVLLRDPSRVGDPAYIDNVSLQGVLVRTAVVSSPKLALLLGAVAALSIWCATRAHRRGDTPGALLCIAHLGLIASPISWTHHWVWTGPLLVCLVARARHQRRAAVLATLVVAVTVLTPFEWSIWVPGVLSPLLWSYVVMGILVVIQVGYPTALPPLNPQRVRRAPDLGDQVVPGRA